MEIFWSISAKERLVRLKYIGKPDYSTWKEIMLRIFSHPDYRPGFGFVADLSESEVPDGLHLQQVREFFDSHRREMTGGRWANVTRDAAHYGMSRMAQVLSEDLPASLRIFSNITEAEQWVRGKSDPTVS